MIVEPTIYDRNSGNRTTKLIDNLIKNQLLPNYLEILKDRDPVPTYGLKLLSILLEKNITLVSMLKQMKIVDLIVSYFQGTEHPHLYLMSNRYPSLA